MKIRGASCVKYRRSGQGGPIDAPLYPAINKSTCVARGDLNRVPLRTGLKYILSFINREMTDAGAIEDPRRRLSTSFPSRRADVNNRTDRSIPIVFGERVHCADG